MKETYITLEMVDFYSYARFSIIFILQFSLGTLIRVSNNLNIFPATFHFLKAFNFCYFYAKTKFLIAADEMIIKDKSVNSMNKGT